MELVVIRYIVEECERQNSGYISVYDMCNAWDHAQHHADKANLPRVDNDFIERLGYLTEPVDNRNGFRTIPIYVGNGFDLVEKARWERVPYLLTQVIEAYYEGRLNPKDTIRTTREQGDWSNYKHLKKAKTAEDVFYYEYENIHPFVDGNGRTGKILYNYLNGTLDNPILPPNFWNSSNP